MADVFIDYEVSDSAVANDVARELKRLGFSSFLIENLEPAERTRQRLAAEAQSARAIVVLWSAATAAALKQRGALARAAEFISYWSEGRLVLARLDRADLPLGLRDVVSIPLRVDLVEAAAGAAAKIASSSSSPGMANLSDQDWEGATQLWATDGAVERAGAPAAPATPATTPELGDHDWQSATQVAGAGSAALFVSYAHRDLSRVDPIVSDISALGFSIWIDRNEMSSASGWAGQITRAIKGSRAVVLMASTLAYSSDQVVREMYLAMNAKKKIVPLELEPATINDEFEYILAPFQRFKIYSGPREPILSRALHSA